MVSSPPLSGEHLDRLETMVREVSEERFTSWDLAQVEIARQICQDLRSLSGQTRREALNLLAEGVSAAKFLEIMGPIVARLRPLQQQMQAMLSQPIPRPIPEPIVDYLIDCAATGKDVLSLLDLLSEPLARAAAPPPPLDPERAERVKAAYARGETKSFRRPATTGQG
jgi:hypothetical protein